MNSDQLINEIKTSIIRWYPFRKDADFIYIGQEDALFSHLREQYGNRVKRYAPEKEDIENQKNVEVGNDFAMADYVISIGYPELIEEPIQLLIWIRAHLKPDGRLILGMNNRFGIKYFCGDKDPYTMQVFDGIDDYFRAYKSPDDRFAGRCYDQKQLKDMLIAAGFSDQKLYSVFSDLENATHIFADGYLPSEELYIRIFPTYNSPSTVFLEEERLYSALLRNGMFHKMANGYLIECSPDGTHTDALQITNSLDRGHADSMITIIHENDTVTKQAPFKEGEKRLKLLDENMRKLRNRGVPTVEGRLEEGVYIMPFIKAETGMVYLNRIATEDPELFFQRLDEFSYEIMKASKSFEDIYDIPVPSDETEEEREKRLKCKKEPWEEEKMLLMEEGFVDMIPLNSFFINGKFVFYDQEFCMKNYPFKAIMLRVLTTAYTGTPKQEKLISKKELYGRYGIDFDDKNRLRYLTEIADDWLNNVLHRRELFGYRTGIYKDNDVIYANRQRMNFSVDDYQKLFVETLDTADARKLIIFGSGVFAKRFLAIYGKDYEIYKVIDNNEKRWGQMLYPEGYEGESGGIAIQSPKILGDLRHGEYKVIICIKNFRSVIKQLDEMGVYEYSIFDPSKAYPRKRHPLSDDSVEHFQNSTVNKAGGKRYHIGYIAGVFDLYHVGHLNMFKRAKEMCDYLIVGVVSDEGVRHVKRTEPFVPFEERIEMVSSCRYVDEAVEIPYMYGGTEDAWRMHHFDVQFSGSDYMNDPGFRQYKEFLEKHGATMEFFPYTQSTSSTKLKELIEKKLL